MEGQEDMYLRQNGHIWDSDWVGELASMQLQLRHDITTHNTQQTVDNMSHETTHHITTHPYGNTAQHVNMKDKNPCISRSLVFTKPLNATGTVKTR